MKKIWSWIKSNKKVILKSLLIVAILITIAFCGYGILYLMGFTSTEKLVELKNNLGDNFLFWLVVACLQIFQVIFIPVSNQIITIPLALIFSDELWKVWICSWVSIWLATIILYFIGRFGGDKILNWLLNDKEQVNKCVNWLNKGWIFYPLGMLLPLPDDIITILSGTAKFNVLFVLVCSFFTRGIDTACSVFGFGFLTRYWWGWLLLAIGIVLLGVMTFLFHKYQKKLETKR